MEILYHHILTPCGEPADIIISALQKFIRRGKTEEAARAAYELYLSGEELRDYLWQRLLVISAEDVGLGQPAAPSVVLSLYRASQKLGADSMDYPCSPLSVQLSQGTGFQHSGQSDQAADPRPRPLPPSGLCI